MALVFISHASVDNEKVQDVTDYIKQNGFDFIFLDYDEQDGIKVGEDWEKRLYHELKRSHAIVVLLSPTWIKSTWCRIEYSQAKALGKEIIPIIIDNGEENEVNKWLDDHIQRSDLTSDKEVLSRVLERIKEIALDTQKDFKWNQNRSPYPGLLSFEEQDAAIFFGREDESREVIQKLKAMQHHNAPKLLNIVAASGMGKSSLLKAGVLPKLKLSYANEWEVLPPFRPRTRPLYEFSKFIARVLSKQSEYKSIYKELQSASYKEVLDDIVTELEFLSAEKKSILFSLDQAEELYSLSDEKEKALFLQALGYLLEHKENFFAIWTLRSDFLKEHQLDRSSKELHRLSEIFSLNALSPQSITSVIREPAKVAGMGVDDELIEKIKEDLKTTDALPILALCLNELYHKHKKSGHLTLSHYENLTANGTNPLENIIKEKANEAIKAFKEDKQTLLALKNAFIPHLIRVNSENEYIKRVAKLAELPEEAHKAIEALVKQRLLITKNIEGEEFVEIAHEALIREWGLLQEWLKDEHHFLIGKSKLERSLVQWQEKNKANNALLLGVELENALVWKEKLSDADEVAYVKRSIEHDKQTKKRKKLFRVLAFTFITLFALLSFWQMNVAKENEKKAQNLVYKGTMEQGFIYKDYLNDSVKAKHLFAKSVVEGTNDEERRNGKIVYDSFQNGGELSNIFEHNDSVYGVIFSQDEKKILSWSRDNTVKLWSIQSDEPLLVLKHDNVIWGAIFSQDAKQILSWSQDNTVKLWSIKSDKPLLVLKHDDDVNGAMFSQDEKQILSWSWDKTVKLWSINSDKPLLVLKHDAVVNGAMFSQDAKQILSWSWDKTVKLWSINSDEPLLVLKHDDIVWGAMFSQDAKQILSWSGDKTVKLWSINSDKPLLVLKHDASVVGAIFSQDDKQILSWSGDNTVKLWNITSDKPLLVLKHDAVVNGAMFSQDGKQLLSWSEDKTVKLWSIKSDKPFFVLKHENAVLGAMFSQDEKQILSWSRDKTVKLWSINSDKPLLVLKHDDVIWGAMFSQDEKQILSWSDDKIVKLWSINSDKSLLVLKHDDAVKDDDDVNGAMFSQDERQILSWNWDKTVKLWSINSDEPLLVLKHDDYVNGAMFSQDEKQILSWSEDNIVKLWSINSDKPLLVLKHDDIVNGAMFSQDKKQILSWSWDNTVKLWSIKSDEPLLVLKHEDAVMGAIFSQDSKQILSWSRDKRVKLWSIKSDKPLLVVKHDGSVLGVVFSQDSKQILSWSGDKTVKLWSINSDIPLLVLKHDASVYGAIFSQDEKQILSWSEDKRVKLWSIKSDEPLLVLKHDDWVSGAMFSQDEKQILSWSRDKRVKLWSIYSDKPLLVLNHDAYVNGAMFSKDEKQILSWSWDKTVKLWSINSDKPLLVLKHDDIVDGAMFSKDENQILSWSEAGVIKIYDLQQKRKLNPKDYSLETEVKSGTYLSDAGEVKALSKKEWLEKKEKYEKALAEAEE